MHLNVIIFANIASIDIFLMLCQMCWIAVVSLIQDATDAVWHICSLHLMQEYGYFSAQMNNTVGNI